jgi:hypothetical protein
MRKLLSPFSALVLLLTAQAAGAQMLQVQTPRGVMLEVSADFPAGKGPFPAVVLAPGQGYPMTQAGIEQPARKLVERGVAVFRFNWAYYTKDAKEGRPSKDLTLEVEDMQAVLDRARGDARVAADKLFVAGKSLGSIVAWKLLRADPQLKGAVLFTPICSRRQPGSDTPLPVADSNYPELSVEARPIAFIVGDHDPLCLAPQLYRFAAGAKGPVRVAVVGGNHSFEDPALTGAAATAATQRNIELVAQLAADFVATAARP